MAQNVGTADRVARLVGAALLLGASFVAPLPLAAQLALGLSGLYVLGTSLVGTCLGYKLIGRSTCPLEQRGSR